MGECNALIHLGVINRWPLFRYGINIDTSGWSTEK